MIKVHDKLQKEMAYDFFISFSQHLNKFTFIILSYRIIQSVALITNDSNFALNNDRYKQIEHDTEES